MSDRPPAPPPDSPASPRPDGQSAALAPGWTRCDWQAGALLLLATLAAYSPALSGGFIWDDPRYVSENPLLWKPGGLLDIWRGRTVQYYPLVFTSFWVEYRLWGLWPAGYHATNIVLHGLSALLLWRLLRRLNVPGAGWAAAVFALHPVHVESVAWITERKNVLSGFLYLAAAHAWLRFEADRGARRYLILLALFAAALLSKTVACSLPVAIALVQWWRRRGPTRQDGLALAPMLAMGVLAGLVTSHYERTVVGAVGAEWDLSFAQRCQIAGNALWFYIGKLLWPARLTFVYPRWPVDAASLRWWIGPAAAVLAAIVLMASAARGRRGPLVALTFFAITVFPALGFVNTFPMRYAFVADHFQYMASIGPIVMVVAGASLLAARTNRRWVLPLGGGLLLCSLGLLTARQARSYESLDRLWRDTILRNPACQMAYHNLANLRLEQGRADEAVALFDQALALSPADHETLFCRGNALRIVGRLAEAERALRAALAARPDYLPARVNLAGVVMELGRYDEALASYESLAREHPGVVEVQSGWGRALHARGDLPAAIERFERALAQRPGLEDVRLELADALRAGGDDVRALRVLAEGRDRQPRSRALAAAMVRLMADSADPKVRDPGSAVTLAKRLAAAEDPGSLELLATALRSDGRLEEALHTLRQAIATCHGRSEHVALRARLEQRLHEWQRPK